MSLNFCSEIEVFLVKNGPYMLYITFQTVKRGKTETTRVDDWKNGKFFLRHSKILVTESLFRPPKLGAKSQSMATRNNHIIYMCNQCSGMPHSFIDDLFLSMVHVFYCPAPHGLPQGAGLNPSTHRLHVLIWSPLTACDVLGQLYADDV